MDNWLLTHFSRPSCQKIFDGRKKSCFYTKKYSTSRGIVGLCLPHSWSQLGLHFGVKCLCSSFPRKIETSKRLFRAVCLFICKLFVSTWDLSLKYHFVATSSHTRVTFSKSHCAVCMSYIITYCSAVVFLGGGGNKIMQCCGIYCPTLVFFEARRATQILVGINNEGFNAPWRIMWHLSSIFTS